MGWWWSQNWKKSRFLFRVGAVSFVLLAGASAAALLLGHYAGFSSWPDLLSGGKSTNAGSASLTTGNGGAKAHGGATFLNLGQGNLPFATAGVAPFPLPGAAPTAPGLLIANPTGPGGAGPGNGGGNGNGANGNGRQSVPRGRSPPPRPRLRAEVRAPRGTQARRRARPRHRPTTPVRMAAGTTAAATEVAAADATAR